MLILDGDIILPQPDSFSIHTGIKTNVKAAISGYVWGRRTSYMDTLSLDLGEWLVEDTLFLQDWLYQRSLRGWRDFADSFNLYIERMPTGVENKGFNGKVRYDGSTLTSQLKKHWSGSYSLDLKIIEYLDLP